MDSKWLKEAAASTPDPDRAENNLLTFVEENPDRTDELLPHARAAAMLFSCSQFLANYTAAHPDALFRALKEIDTALEQEALAPRLTEALAPVAASPQRLPDCMAVVRRFRIEEMIGVTLRDILGRSEVADVMRELSSLADVIIAHSLDVVSASLRDTYGAPADDAFAVIGLGKLGGEELNFSSDVDLIYVYGSEQGETEGVATARGTRKNRISNHEYYCKLGEALSRFLSLNTEAGFAFRVDLRLRPEGQRGDLALALRGYEMYYESWGRAWERAMLIRARPIAGDGALGREFLTMIRPFVYRKYLDFSAIDEIRRLKTRIDSSFKKEDIKRGYGGIREIEFFVQALQLIYGGKEPLLRERSVLRALHGLLQKSLVGREDFTLLSDNYRYLRTLEHRLQQMNDIQTHTVPTAARDLDRIARKMGATNGVAFSRELDSRRTTVRAIYDSLFSGDAEPTTVGGAFFDEEMSDAELKDDLLAAGVGEAERAVRNVRAIRDTTFAFQTLRGRRLLGEILPIFVEAALRSGAPDAALNHLQSFAQLLSANESYVEIFKRAPQLIPTLTRAFAQSSYLSKLLIGRPAYLEMIGWEGPARKSLKALRHEIDAAVGEGHSLNDALRLIRQAEEIRLGLLFLDRRATVIDITRGLSRTADAVLSACLDGAGSGISIVGLGKLGGREITFNSDLDIVFVTPDEPLPEATKTAEKLLRMLIAYTKEGIAYRVDTRLRPAGSKGPLVASIAGMIRYYMESAAPWELQALLKARPVAGDPGTCRTFLENARTALIRRGGEVTAEGIRRMRERILKELAKENEGYDIKLGPGGIEDLEFMIQYLQLRHGGRHARLLVQGTLPATHALRHAAVIAAADAAAFAESYLFYRTLESYLRLRGEGVLKKEGPSLTGAAGFVGLPDADSLERTIHDTRLLVGRLVDRYVV